MKKKANVSKGRTSEVEPSRERTHLENTIGQAKATDTIIDNLHAEGNLPTATLMECYVQRGIEDELVQYATSSQRNTPPLVLVGAVGTGKSTTIKYVAEKLKSRFSSRISYVDLATQLKTRTF